MRVAPYLPDLGRAQARSGGDKVRAKRLFVDHPAVPPMHVSAVEPESPRPGGAAGVDGLDLGELAWHRAVVSLGTHNAEPHQLSGGALAYAIPEDDLRAHRVLREVHDHVEALCGGNRDTLVGDRRAQQADVAPDLDEGVPAGGRRVELELVASGVGGVENAKAVHRVRDFHKRPGCTVHENGVGENPLQKVVLDPRLVLQRWIHGWVEKGAVLLEGPVADHEWNVLLAFRQGEVVFDLVADDVEAGQPLVNLGTGEVHAVVVVPERGCRLVHRVDVLLGPAIYPTHRDAAVAFVPVERAVSRQDEVCWVTVALGRRHASVQVDYRRHRQFVALVDHDLPSALGLDSGTWEIALVAPDSGIEPRQDLRPYLFLRELVVIRLGVGVYGLQNRRDGQRDGERFGQGRRAAQQRSRLVTRGATGGPERKGQRHAPG